MIVRIEPLGRMIDVLPGETVMAAGQRAGLKWPTACGGNAQCGYCHVAVLEGADALAQPAQNEAFTLAQVVGQREGKTMRLACQLKAVGDLVIERAGIR
jgi:2Fe-2S ferredoxin